jgi:phytoene dehydrogenase-like protein
MAQPDYDVAIIGGGHNGLTCAAYLARAGRRVVVLEKNDVVGGAAITEEFHPGFRNSVASYTVSLLNPKVIADLELAGHGLTVIERPVANYWPLPKGPGLLMPYGLEARQAAIAAFSERDAQVLPRYDACLETAADFLRDLVLRTPPNVGGGVLEMVRNASLGRAMLALETDVQQTIVDLFTKSAADFLAQWFEHDLVRAAFAFDGIVGAYASPFMPGTAYVLLHHCFGEVNGKSGVWGHAMGGMGAISAAIANSAREAGAEIRTGAGIARVVAPYGRATGVTLSSGEMISAHAVAANVTPKLLFRDLIEPADVPSTTRARFTGIRSGSGTFRMNVALSELPDFTGRPGAQTQEHHGAGIIIGPGMGYLERAYLDSRANGWSSEPIIEMLIPSTLDPSLAPAGQHVAPQLPGGRTWEDDREKNRFADLVIDTVAHYAPNFKDSVLGRQMLSPLDLEKRFGLTDGDIFHGQLGLDQMFATRPVLGSANYRLPLQGLYLCGSGAHPGGGVTGAPGHNAAREILRDLKWRRS